MSTGWTATQVSAYTNLICGLVSDGIINGAMIMDASHNIFGSCGTILDIFYIFAAQDTNTALTNICQSSDFKAAASGSPGFTPFQSYSGTGNVADYLDSRLCAISSGNPCGIYTADFTLNSAHISAYVRTSRTTACTCDELGTQGSAGNTATDLVPITAGGLFAEINANGTAFSPPPNANGMWVVSRTAASGTGAVSVYRNGSVLGSATTASVGLSNCEINILATTNNTCATVNPTTDQIAAVTIGAGLTASQALQLSTRINTFMTQLGINVY